jgi:ornithine decarboxylase
VFNLLRKYGHSPKVIDIGGGFTANPEEFDKTAAAIKEGLKCIAKTVKVIAEPGRYFAQPSQDLFVKVIAKKRGLNGVGWRYVIDESLYGHFSCIPFDHQTPAWFRIPQSDSDSEVKRTSSEAILFGRTCDSLDVIAKGVIENLEVGDWLYFPMMGAYTSATASEFNGFPKPELKEDSENLLPESPWKMIEEFHGTQALTYSNALPPIL